MREILFRAKRKNGMVYRDTGNIVWEYGYLLGDFIASGYRGSSLAPIRPETIGQFTGLLDKNGKKIFEGDIVRDAGRKGTPLEVVKFEGGGFYPFAVPGWECTPEGQDVEIVGNIYDNPEILRGEQDGNG